MNTTKFQYKLQNLTGTKQTDYLLWEVVKDLSPPITRDASIRLSDEKWARSNAEKREAFASYLPEVFKPIEPTKGECLLNTNMCRPEKLIRFTINDINMII